MPAEQKTLKVAPGEHGRSLSEFLVFRLGISRKAAKRLIDDRTIFINHQRTWMAKHKLNEGDILEVRNPKARNVPVAEKPLLILHEDDDYLIIDKPPHMLANGPDSAESRLQHHFTGVPLQAVHRLDRDTSGCFLLAKSQRAFEDMVKVFQDRAVTKVYKAIATGQVPRSLHVIRAPIEGQEAITHVRVLRQATRATLLELNLETGRTHQIRRHLLAAGHPLVGDKHYQTRALENEALRRAPRQMLHAARLSFKHPKTGQTITATADLPPDFLATQRALEIS